MSAKTLSSTQKKTKKSGSQYCLSSLAIAWLLLAGLAVAGPLAAAELKSPLDRLNTGDLKTASSGLVHFETARTNLWSANGAPAGQSAFLDRAAADFKSISDGAARAYLLADVELYRGRIALTEESESAARPYFEAAMSLADESIAVRESSDAWRVKADAGSSWMITKGLGGIIKMAPQVQKWSDRAVELDGENALAIIISAQGQINAPKGSGGNPPEAARRLEDLNARTDLGDVERFWTRVSLSQAYDKLKRKDDSARLCAMAAQIFPKSPMLSECRKD